MSGTSAVRYLLANNATLIATVPAARIYIGTAPLNTTLPAIVVSSVSGRPETTVAMTESGRIYSERVQVTVWAASYAVQIAVMRLARAALPNTRGTVNSIALDSIMPAGDGPDLFYDDASIYQGSLDLMVRWHLP